jgi:DNA repair exonuclease SbcCD ATPase subunit
MLLLALLSSVVFADPIADAIQSQRQLNSQVTEMRDAVSRLATEAKSREDDVREELKALKTELANVEVALKLTEDYANKKPDLESFDEFKAEAVLQRMVKLADVQDSLVAKVLHAHDLELYEKLEQALGSMSKSKQAVQQQMLVVKARVAEIETIIRKDSRFFWAYILVAAVCLTAFLSYRTVTKKPN